MTIMQRLSTWGEGLPVPDAVSRMVIASLVGRTARSLAAQSADAAAFARDMAEFPIAVHADAANAQHYEVPAAFFDQVLGPRRKYSCCYYADPGDTLAAAEQNALELAAEHAGLADGQDILELGCGWGSLSLWMARQFPHAKVTAVSASQAQRAHIEEEARRRGLLNLRVVTADMNVFAPEGQFDRIVSVETFEHIMNWRKLMTRLRAWLAPEGRLFMHVVSHRSGSHLFDRANREDWIAQHVFTGGLMPSHHLVRQFDDIFAIEKEWCWSGTHYQHTANDWLANFDAHRDAIEASLRKVHGEETALWMRRWRWFLLATSGQFGYADGTEWGVSHYRMRAAE